MKKNEVKKKQRQFLEIKYKESTYYPKTIYLNTLYSSYSKCFYCYITNYLFEDNFFVSLTCSCRSIVK